MHLLHQSFFSLAESISGECMKTKILSPNSRMCFCKIKHSVQQDTSSAWRLQGLGCACREKSTFPRFVYLSLLLKRQAMAFPSSENEAWQFLYSCGSPGSWVCGHELMRMLTSTHNSLPHLLSSAVRAAVADTRTRPWFSPVSGKSSQEIMICLRASQDCF